jgi:hypothetical protein
MDFWKTIGVLLRRWYVAVPVFFVALVIGGGVFLKVPTQYVSTGTMVLTAPTAGATTAVDPAHATGPGNPLLDFEGSLTITTQLLIQSMSSPSVAQQIAEQGGVDTYQAGDGNTGGPFVVIVATANSPQEAELTVSLALKYAQNELNARQKNLNAPPSTYIGTQSVVSPTQATTKISNKVKDGGIALVAGLVLSLATAYGVDSWLSGRRRRRAAEEADDALIDDLELDDDVEPDDGSADPTKKMRPASPPRHVPAPQPVRSGVARPQPIPANAGHREQHGPVYGPHPAKPRPTPVPTNGNTSNGTKNNGNGNGNNGNGNRMDWPRTEFRSPDSSTG